MALKVDNSKLTESIISTFDIEPNTCKITKVLVEGCKVGDFVNLSFIGKLGNVILTSQVTSTNTVTVKFMNPFNTIESVGIGKLIIKIN